MDKYVLSLSGVIENPKRKKGGSVEFSAVVAMENPSGRDCPPGAWVAAGMLCGNGAKIQGDLSAEAKHRGESAKIHAFKASVTGASTKVVTKDNEDHWYIVLSFAMCFEKNAWTNLGLSAGGVAEIQGLQGVIPDVNPKFSRQADGSLVNVETGEVVEDAREGVA